MLNEMKKIEKIKLSNYKEILVNTELKQLKGGSDDINNNNSEFSCTCRYDNYNAINNTNSAFGCTCQCT